MKTLPIFLLLVLIGYGCKKEVFKPTVTTSEAEQITSYSAIVGGNVTSVGSSDLTDRGIYWGTSANPMEEGTKISIGVGTGIFSTTIYELIEQTKYYYQAFAVNLQGSSYGNLVSFTTLSNSGTFFDPRDQHEYKWVRIGEQVWMAENLAWLPDVSPSSDESYTNPYYYVYGYEGSNVASAKATANYTNYGVLYNWPSAWAACPAGWHLPSEAEWTILTDYLTNNGYGYGGSGSDIGKSMASSSGWTSYSSDGTIGNEQGNNNRSGFTALPGGGRYYYGGGFYGLGYSAYFWSSSEVGSTAWSRYLFFSFNVDGVSWSSFYRCYGFSVRCLWN